MTFAIKGEGGVASALRFFFTLFIDFINPNNENGCLWQSAVAAASERQFWT